MPKTLFVLIALTLIAIPAPADERLIDDCGATDHWSVSAAEGVEASISLVPGRDGQALRVDYHFKAGGGYWVLRRDAKMTLPANYDFRIDVRGEGPPNNLEFKLCDPANENVWWVWRGGWATPTAWETLRHKRRHFRFAWGPSGGEPLETIGGVEIAMSAAEGGRGFLIVDNLRFEELESVAAVSHAPRIFVSSSAAGAAPPSTLGAEGRVGWRSAPDVADASLTLDFQQLRSFGGVRIDFASDATPEAYDVEVTRDGVKWEAVAHVGAMPATHFVSMPDCDARGLRVVAQGPMGIERLELAPLAFGDDHNQRFLHIAQAMPIGAYPRQFLNKQTFWTTVGLPDDDAEALLDETGMLEACAGKWSICPTVVSHGRALNWSDARRSCALERGDLPIPSVAMDFEQGLRLTVSALATGEPGASRTLARYRLTNTSNEDWSGSLVLQFRPFQVLPPWQTLNRVGGAGRIDAFSADAGAIVIDGRTIVMSTAPNARSRSQERSGRPGDGLLSGAATWPIDTIPAGGHADITLAIPLHDEAPAMTRDEIDFDAALARETKRWSELLDRTLIRLPASAAGLADTFRTTQAYILINADGAAIQPGSRTYERSWIRDGAMTATALLYTGHTARARDFIEWYAPFQFENGMIPAIVDQRGPDPIPEHDSTGEFIHLLYRYYQFSGDRSILERHFPAVERGVAYLDQLRRQRMSGPYVDGTDTQKACYGLVTESISHEGYSPARHSYWDGFWTLRGLQDARDIATALGRSAEAARFDAFYQDYLRCTLDSIRKAREIHGCDYVPGCVELGDFDPTSTAIAIFPCAQARHLPQDALQATFDRYMTFFRDRRDGRIEWEGYTPYELRTAGAMALRNRVAEAHELLDFFMTQQRPAGWNHWAEVIYRDPDMPKYIGDMPHTWVGSGFMNSLRMMLLYERDADQALVLAAGVPRDWTLDEQGVSVANLPTMFGEIAYQLRRVADRVVFELDSAAAAPGGVWLTIPANAADLRVSGGAARVTNGQLRLPNGAGRVTVSWSADQP